jgi:hypothetical protein
MVSDITNTTDGCVIPSSFTSNNTMIKCPKSNAHIIYMTSDMMLVWVLLK